jgi:hypothetical protein
MKGQGRQAEAPAWSHPLRTPLTAGDAGRPLCVEPLCSAPDAGVRTCPVLSTRRVRARWGRSPGGPTAARCWRRARRAAWACGAWGARRRAARPPRAPPPPAARGSPSSARRAPRAPCLPFTTARDQIPWTGIHGLMLAAALLLQCAWLRHGQCCHSTRLHALPSHAAQCGCHHLHLPQRRCLRSREARARACRCRVSALSWSPDGQLLAAAAEGMPGFMLWDVSLGTGTLLRSGAPAACQGPSSSSFSPQMLFSRALVAGRNPALCRARTQPDRLRLCRRSRER